MQRGDDLRQRLGPEIADATHGFRLEQRVQGETADGIVLVGHGLCRIVQRGEGQFSIDLESPQQDVRLDRRGVTLNEVATLAATIVDGDGRAVDARGNGCRRRKPDR